MTSERQYQPRSPEGRRQLDKMTARQEQRDKEFHCFGILPTQLTWKERQKQEKWDRRQGQMMKAFYILEIVIILVTIWMIAPSVIEHLLKY